jgi:S-(hydroxymethyl)glutathione dehydrogenase/alcohol dehydrogenase
MEIRDDVQLADLGPTDVHMELVSSGVCHSDLSVQNGTIPMPPPCILGHEGAGIVKEVGSAVTELVAGDHAILSFTPACRVCKPCLRGQSYLCEATATMAASPRFIVDGKPMAGMTGCGTFAEEMVVPEAAVIKVDDDIPLNVVSLIGCGVTTGVCASLNTAGVTPGSSVLVFGAGGVGISAIQGARIAGASTIVAVDRVESKLEIAKKFGATPACLPDQLEDVKNELTGGEGFDFTLECVGHPTLIRQSYDMARRGGVATIVGVGKLDQMVQFSAFEFFYGGKTLKGSMYGSANVRIDFPRLLGLWKNGALDLEGMISRRIPLEGVNDAFRAMEKGEVIRSVIDFK